MATAVTVLLMVLVMAAAVALVRARRQLLPLIDRSTWVVVVTGLLASAAPLAALITGDYQLTRDTIRKLDVISVGPLAELVTRAGRPVIILVASGAVAWTLYRDRLTSLRASPAAVIPLAIWGWIALVTFTQGGDVISGLRLAAGAVMVAVALLGRRRGAIIGGALVGLLGAALSVAALMIAPALATRQCTLAKCGISDSLVTGVYGNENAMAIALVLSLPFVLLLPDRLVRISGTALLVACLLAAGSRTSLAVAVPVIALAMLIRPWRQALQAGARVPRVPAWLTALIARLRLHADAVLAVIVGAISLVGLVLPFLVARPEGEAFARRANVWARAIDDLGAHVLVGVGDQRWATLADQGLIGYEATYGVHNFWLQMLYTGGLVALGLMATLVICLVRRGAAVAFTLVPPLAVGILESTWIPNEPTWLLWSVAATVMMTTSAAVGSPRSPDPA